MFITIDILKTTIKKLDNMDDVHYDWYIEETQYRI